MRRFGHLTPRYVLDRTRLHLYQRRNPDTPWLTPRAIELLSSLLLPTDRGMEWGSGRSTAWFAKHIAHLTSVESHPEWYERVKRTLAEQNITNVDYHFAPRPPDDDSARTTQYVTIGASIPDASLGMALVDGEARPYCAELVIPKIAVGGVLIIDNAEWFLDHPTHSPSSRAGLGPANDLWATIHQSLSSWRRIWTTSGVTDTAIWIKPSPTR